MASPNEIKKGTVLKINDELWVVTDFQRVSPGKGGSFVRTKMKSLSSGKVNDNSFKAAETLEFVEVLHKKMQYIFGDIDTLTFMDDRTYEQVVINRDLVGDDAKYLKEGLEVVVSIYNENPIAVEIPKKVEYTVTETEPAVKGDTASGNVQKDAVADNGLKIRVPIFVKVGDVVRINTETGDYVERVN
ncbi:MAG: elongation factor P [Patescibacteria group bacterium]|nr:elongation factor P [Patescibacteria group bacterium]